MKASLGAALLLLCLSTLPCAAQAAPAPRSGSSAPVTDPAVGPGEPDIIMPQVVLQVEDLSVEKVEAQLPPEEEMLPPVRTIPVLSEGELAVGEPTIPAAPVEAEGPARPSNDRLLSSDVQLGAGTLSSISGSMALTTLGPDPRMSLQFHHETLDGFNGHVPGSGFSLRNDSLDGGLKFRLAGVATDLTGGFKEDETGLQGQSAVGYSSALSRVLSGAASFSGSLTDWLTLAVEAGGGFDSLTLQGTSPLSSSGLRLAPTVSAEARFAGVKIGLETRYWYRDDSYLLGGQGQLHRVKIGSIFSLDLPSTFVLQASAGWFLNSAGLSLFPFSVSITGTPFEMLTLSLEGGYKVVPYDMHDILSSSSLALTTSQLADDRGWYADSSAQLSLTRDLAVTVKADFMAHDAMPTGSTTLDSTTNSLFQVTQTGGENGLQLSTNAGLRWGITQAFSLSAGLSYEIMNRPFFTPRYAVTGGLVGLEPSGRFGGSLTVSAGPIYDNTYQQPVLHVSGFWKIIEAVKLQIDGDDLLAPLLSGPRWSIARNTYITPGFRIAASLGMSL
ncbi:MAG: hypothetical protein ABSG21_02335 [Spirochaetia bacterium]